ncbi:MAG: four helix bundle protein [Nitrospirae bacterium]|nr:four helix bundle protein [Nitrospirota bacterium]
MTEKTGIKSFRDLNIWKDAIKLVKLIYEITKTFPNSEIYGLTSQIRRAAVSVPSNIAEGHIRRHTAEFRQFLFVALGSLAELETQVIIANELGYVNKEVRGRVIQDMDVLSKQIHSLISKLTPIPQPPIP